MNTKNVALELKGITHTFGDTRVLDDVNLTVNHSSITALLGPSGVGKTTVLRIVAGFERPTQGAVLINGRVVADTDTWIPPHERGISIVPQEGALFPHLSVGENVAFGLKKRKSSTARVRVNEMLDLVGLPDTYNKRPSELSGGMQQRVALARALATNPAVVLLDEPFSALDAGLRESLREHVVEILRTAGATALWVTHDQDEALSTADTVAILLGHKIAQVSDPVSVYRLPDTTEIADFVGEAVSFNGFVLDGGATATCVFGTLELLRPHTTGATTVVIRPEQFEITTPTDPLARSVGEVLNTRYFGHDGTVEVRLIDGTVATVRLHARLLPDVGSTVGVVVNGKVLAF